MQQACNRYNTSTMFAVILAALLSAFLTLTVTCGIMAMYLGIY